MILDRLRERTRTLHERIERTLDLGRRLRSVDTYRELLERFYGYYVPLESRLEAVAGFQSFRLDLTSRKKAPWLTQDLRALGHSVESTARLPRCEDLPEIQNLAQAFGCLYVIEGSTLGGQVIRREVEKNLGITAGIGADFFTGYGEETGNRWRDFCVSCSAYNEKFPEAREEVLTAASQGFDSLNNWIAC